MSKIIYLNHGAKTIVDNDDFIKFNKYKWRMNNTGYATRLSKSIGLAREIMNAKKGEYVDHISGYKLDNRKCNLRITTNQQNNWNKRKKYKGNNRFRGVRKKDNKWQAYATKYFVQINLGRYNTEIEAAKAYDKFVIDNRGEYGITNKMLGNYQPLYKKAN